MVEKSLRRRKDGGLYQAQTEFKVAIILTACCIDCAIDQNRCEVMLAFDAAPDNKVGGSQGQTMENMGRVNSLLDQLMLRDDILAEAAKYVDSLGLLKPIRDFRAAATSQDSWIRCYRNGSSGSEPSEWRKRNEVIKRRH